MTQERAEACESTNKASGSRRWRILSPLQGLKTKMLPVVLGLTPQAMNLSPLRGWYLLTDMDTVADAPGYESVAPAGLEPPPDTTTSWNYWEAAKRRKTFSLGREPQDGNVFP